MKKIVFKNQTPFYLFTISVVVVLTLPVLLQDGMFMDGEQYACVSKNLAFGKGSFWFPFLSETWMREGSANFMEQPPLFFWLQSLFFKLVGTSIYTERIYSFFMLILNCTIIHYLWRLILPNEFKKISWLPVLFWIVTPVCFWSVQNNIIEITLSVFCLSATYFILKGLLLENFKILNIFFGGVFIFLAILTKGLQGLFPLVIIFCYCLSTKKISFKKMISLSFVLVGIPTLLFLGLITFNVEAKQSLFFYIKHRLMQRIANDPTVNNRYFLLILIIQELLPMLVLFLISFFVSKWKFSQIKSENNKMALFFILIGLFGSLPLMLTLVQKNFYFVAAIPFFAIGFALYCSEIVIHLTEKCIKKQKVINSLTIFFSVFLISSITFSLFQIGKSSRDKDVINDVVVLGNYLKNVETVDTDDDIYYSWNFQFYMLRKYNISLDPNKGKQMYYISKKNNHEIDRVKYKRVFLQTEIYSLYVKN